MGRLGDLEPARAVPVPGREHWRAAFAADLDYSHLGYPLLVPAAVARLWAFSGETTVAPAAVSAVFTIAPALTVAGAVARHSGPVAGATAALLLVAAEGWVFFGASQCADVPLASSSRAPPPPC